MIKGLILTIAFTAVTVTEAFSVAQQSGMLDEVCIKQVEVDSLLGIYKEIMIEELPQVAQHKIVGECETSRIATIAIDEEKGNILVVFSGVNGRGVSYTLFDSFGNTIKM